MKVSKAFLFRVFGVLAVLLLGGYYAWANADSIKSLSIQSWPALVIMAIFEAAMLLMNGLFNKVMLNEFSIRLRFVEWFGMSALNTSGNLLLPFRGGIVINGIYLKKRHDFSLSDYLVTVMGTYVVTFFCNASVGILAMAYLYKVHGIHSWLITLPLLGVAALLGTAMAWNIQPLLARIPVKGLGRYFKVIGAWERIRGKRKIIAFIVMITILNLIFAAIATFFGFKAIGRPIDPAISLLLGIVAGFSSMLSILPANLGVRELMTGISSTLLGVTAVHAVMVSLIERILVLTISVIGSCACLPFLLDDKKKLKPEDALTPNHGLSSKDIS